MVHVGALLELEIGALITRNRVDDGTVLQAASVGQRPQQVALPDWLLKDGDGVPITEVCRRSTTPSVSTDTPIFCSIPSACPTSQILRLPVYCSDTVHTTHADLWSIYS